jgi:hypothetical protein
MTETASQPAALWNRLASSQVRGWLLNIFFRACIVFFALDSVINSSDERYAGKGLPIRNVVIVLVWTMVFPALFLIWKKWKAYPVAYDNLYLSVFWLDMAGNWLDLYNVMEGWDTLPHFHGPGALTLIWRGLGRRSLLASTGVANMIHVTLEVQEYLGDVVSGTHNVEGAGDTAHDLAAGLIGSWVYVGGWELFHRWRGTKRLPDLP